MDDPTSKAKTHSELVASLSAVDPNGNLWFLPRDKAPELGFGHDSVNPQLRSLFSAAHILYRVSAGVRDMLEPLIAVCEEHGLDVVVPSLLAHQSALDTAMRCATEGIEKILKSPK